MSQKIALKQQMLCCGIIILQDYFFHPDSITADAEKSNTVTANNIARSHLFVLVTFIINFDPCFLFKWCYICTQKYYSWSDPPPVLTGLMADGNISHWWLKILHLWFASWFFLSTSLPCTIYLRIQLRKMFEIFCTIKFYSFNPPHAIDIWYVPLFKAYSA